MKVVKKAEVLPFPEVEPVDNFKYEVVTETGSVTVYFKWLENRWRCWVELPTGETRQAGVFPNVINWTGFTDYGLMFMTNLSTIDYNSLFLCQMVLIQWV